MLMPKKVKYRRRQKGRMKGKALAGSSVDFGNCGLKALEPGWISNRQIEAARIAITRHTKRGGKLWIRIFPDKPISKKPAETRMGKGKGAPEGWEQRQSHFSFRARHGMFSDVGAHEVSRPSDQRACLQEKGACLQEKEHAFRRRNIHDEDQAIHAHRAPHGPGQGSL